MGLVLQGEKSSGDRWWRTIPYKCTKYYWKKVKSEATQSYPTLCDPVDCSLPGSSIFGILQARILAWVAISSSRGSSRPRDQTLVSCIAGRCFTLWATREAQHKIGNQHFTIFVCRKKISIYKLVGLKFSLENKLSLSKGPISMTVIVQYNGNGEICQVTKSTKIVGRMEDISH